VDKSIHAVRSPRTIDDAYDAALASETRPVAESLKRHSPIQSGPVQIPVERYIDKAFHDLEVEKLWKRVWQMACHEDDIPEIGDSIVYDIADMSFIVVRTGEDEFKSYYNACLHRGRKLRSGAVKGAKDIRCQFHGWTWSLEGRLTQVPCLWDFPDLKRDEQRLPEAKVGRWGRFVFINPDIDAEPFETFIGDLQTHFSVLPYERRFKSAHVAKIIRANWKVTREAFMESYHVIATHPATIAGGVQDLEGKYDVYGNYSRAIRIGGLESLALPDWDALPSDGVFRMRHPLNGWIYERADPGTGLSEVRVTTPAGETGRYTWQGDHIEGALGEVNIHMCNWVGGPQMPASTSQSRTAHDREVLRDAIPSLVDQVPDIEFKPIYFSLFPNFDPWGSFNKIVYRFRPNGSNHEESIMEVMFLEPIPEQGEHRPVRDIHWLGADDDWTEAPELGMLAKLLNQDVGNMQYVQQGLHATQRQTIQLSDYNETKIRHFHDLLEKWLEI